MLNLHWAILNSKTRAGKWRGTDLYPQNKHWLLLLLTELTGYSGKNICKVLLTGIFVTQPKAVVRHCFLAWQTLPPADGIRSSFLPDMCQNHTEDACVRSKLSSFWLVCTTACFSSTLKMITQASVTYKMIKERKAINGSCFEKFGLFLLKEKPWAAITFIFSLLWCLPSGFSEK